MTRPHSCLKSGGAPRGPSERERPAPRRYFLSLLHRWLFFSDFCSGFYSPCKKQQRRGASPRSEASGGHLACRLPRRSPRGRGRGGGVRRGGAVTSARWPPLQARPAPPPRTKERVRRAPGFLLLLLLLLVTMSSAEMGKFNISPDEDSSSYSSNSNDFSYPYPTKPAAMKSHYADIDPENQNFLLDSNLGKKKYETQYHPGTTSFGMSVFNLSNAIVGSGILGLSYAMANTGIALFVILLLFVSIFSLYSVHLLLKTANEGGSLLYEQLGMKAFGMAGKLAASGSITMQNIGAMSSYLFIVKYELPLVIKTFMNIEETTGEWYLNGDYLVLLVSVILILPLSLLKNLGYLGYTSGFSLLCMVFFLIVVIWKMFQIPCPMDSDIMNATLINVTLASLVKENITSDDVCKPKYFIFNSQTVYAVPILTFSFVCHPAILPIYEELKSRSRKRMMNVSYVSFFAMFLMYLLAALFGYLTFYGRVEPELLHTYSAYLGADVLLLIVRLAVLMAVTLTVPVVIFPIRSSITQLLWAGKEFRWWRHCSITVALLAFTNVLVIFVPTIRDIFGFIGASAAAMLIFILPSAFYIKLVKKEPMKSVQKIGAAFFFLSGILVMTGCMTLIILDWTQNVASDGH